MPDHHFVHALAYPSVFKRDSSVNFNNWVITQASLGNSTGREAFFFEAGHSVLFLEMVDNNEKKWYRFDYTIKPPRELKDAIETKGMAWLHKKEGSGSITKPVEIHHEQSWEVKPSGAKKLLAGFLREYQEQLESKQSQKHYSFVWENCYFLTTEKICDSAYSQELNIDTTNVDYMNKFHLGGWKYGMLLNFKNSILFATLVVPLQTQFLRFLKQNHDELVDVNQDSTQIYDVSFPIMLNYANHTFYLIQSYFATCLREGDGRLFDVLASFTLSSLYMGFSLIFHSLPSSFCMKSYPYFISYSSEIYFTPDDHAKLCTAIDVALPVAALLSAITMNSLLLYGAKKTGINFQTLRSRFIDDLLHRPREERLRKINEYIITALIPLCGFSVSTFAKYGYFEKIFEDSNMETRLFMSPLKEPIFSYVLGCLFGFLILKRMKKTIELQRLIQPVMVSLSSLLPAYFVIKAKIDEFAKTVSNLDQMYLDCSYHSGGDCMFPDKMRERAIEREKLDAASHFTTSEFIMLLNLTLGGYLLLSLLSFLVNSCKPKVNSVFSSIRNSVGFFYRREPIHETTPMLDRSENYHSIV